MIVNELRRTQSDFAKPTGALRIGQQDRFEMMVVLKLTPLDQPVPLLARANWNLRYSIQRYLKESGVVRYYYPLSSAFLARWASVMSLYSFCFVSFSLARLSTIRDSGYSGELSCIRLWCNAVPCLFHHADDTIR